jgi:hypothetical protein
VFVSDFVTKLRLDQPFLARTGSVFDDVRHGIFSFSILHPKVNLLITEQKSENIYRSMLNSSHQRSHSMQEGVGISAVKKQEISPSIIVVSSCQVQETTTLELNVVLEDTGLQSAVNIPT